MTIATTTLRELEATIRESIVGIAPTHPVDRDGGWVAADSNRPVGSSTVPRLFFLEVEPGDTVEGGMTGNGDTETDANVDVVADYRHFREEDRGSVLEADRWDLHDRLQDSLHPVISGLTHVALGPPPSPYEDEEVPTKFVIPLTLHYMRQR